MSNNITPEERQDIRTLREMANDEKHYTRGWDLFAECYTDDDFLRVLREAGSLQKAVKSLNRVATVYLEQESNQAYE